jgi:hypothetical protein
MTSGTFRPSMSVALGRPHWPVIFLRVFGRLGLVTFVLAGGAGLLCRGRGEDDGAVEEPFAGPAGPAICRRRDLRGAEGRLTRWRRWPGWCWRWYWRWPAGWPCGGTPGGPARTPRSWPRTSRTRSPPDHPDPPPLPRAAPPPGPPVRITGATAGSMGPLALGGVPMGHGRRRHGSARMLTKAQRTWIRKPGGTS